VPTFGWDASWKSFEMSPAETKAGPQEETGTMSTWRAMLVRICQATNERGNEVSWSEEYRGMDREREGVED
jgi:hypothetical protein